MSTNNINLGELELQWNIGDNNLESVILTSEEYNEVIDISSELAEMILRSRRINWTDNPENPDIIVLRFFDIINGSDYIDLAFREGDLSNALNLVAAISNYYQQDVTDQLDEDEKETIRRDERLGENDPILRHQVYNESNRIFIN